MKQNNDERTAARNALDLARTKVDILRYGISKAIDEHCGCCDATELQAVLDVISSDLLPAIRTMQAAEDAYKPFRSLRRIGRASPSQKTCFKAKTHFQDRSVGPIINF